MNLWNILFLGSLIVFTTSLSSSLLAALFAIRKQGSFTSCYVTLSIALTSVVVFVVASQPANPKAFIDVTFNTKAKAAELPVPRQHTKGKEPSHTTPSPPPLAASEEKKEQKKTANPDFRNVKWGMNKTEVMQAETEAVFVGGRHNYLDYKVVFAGKDYRLSYKFVGGKLVFAEYVYQPETADSIDYVEEFNAIKQELTKNHGLPAKNETTEENNHYVTWETLGTRVTMYLYHKFGVDTLGIGYVAKQHEKIGMGG